MDGWKDGWMERWMDGEMDGWRDGWMERWMDGEMDGWRDGTGRMYNLLDGFSNFYSFPKHLSKGGLVRVLQQKNLRYTNVSIGYFRLWEKH